MRRQSLTLLTAALLLGGAALGAAAQDAPAPAPAPDAAAGGYVAATTADEVRVRVGPSPNFRVVERLRKGTWVVVTAAEGEFARVRVPGGVPVYVHADLVEPQGDGKTGLVAKGDVLLRPTPGQEYFPLEGQKLQKGEELVVLGKESGERGEWLKVLPPARVEFYVAMKLLERVGSEADKAGELARIELERRDAYTGGKEAEAARESMRKMEVDFARIVDAAAKALAAARGDDLPADADVHREGLLQVMTESGDPSLRARAAAVSRDLASREKSTLTSRVRAEKEAVAGELERRLAEVEARYQKRLDEILKAGPGPKRAKFHAVGTVRRNVDGSFDLVKGEVVLHSIDSLRYDLEELVGLRVGINGKEIQVDATKGIVLYRVDALEILE